VPDRTDPSSPNPSGSPSGPSGSATSAASAGLTLAGRMTLATAAIAAAQAHLLAAQAGRSEATLRSPMSGTIAVQPYTAGGAESSKDRITVTGPGAAQVTLDVSLTSMSGIRTGLHAEVLPDGGTLSASGTVTAIGLLPSSAAGSSPTTYPVQVLVAAPPASFYSGGRAGVSIVIRTVQGVVTVPNSALADGRVRVLQGDTAVPTAVRTATVGQLTTEVVTGLRPGQRVVLADLSQPLPASSTTNIRRLTGGPGNGGGGGRRAGPTGRGAG